jgi:hypothetical protein
MISLHNWLNNLVESFTFYGGSAGRGGTVGGGLPSNPMGSRFGGNPNMPQGQPGMPQNPMFRGMRTPPTQPQGLPPMPQGMPPSQGQPMQGGQLGNMGAYVSPMAQQPQTLPIQSNFGQPTPDMLNNFKMKFQEQVQRMGNPPMQGQPSQGGLFGNMSAYTSPAANFNQQQNTSQGQVSPGLQGLQGLLKGNLLNTSSAPYTGPQY